MYHNQIQQVQQRINMIQQMVSQMRQNEQHSAQQLGRMQQLCQECSSSLQNVTPTQTGFTGMGTISPGAFSTQQYSPGLEGSLGTTAGLFDPATMNPSTYWGTQQVFGSAGTGSYPSSPLQSGSLQQQHGVQQQQQSPGLSQEMGLGTTPFASVSTMGPSTYQDAMRQLGGTPPNLSQIGQQAGISGTTK